MNTISWPEGKKFAFTIFDDTDLTTIENGPPIYDILADLGFRTTKSVWPLQGKHKPFVGGTTCQDADYLAWVKSLQEKGFEIALHNVTFHSSTRQEIQSGFEQFHDYFGAYPGIHVNHADCQDNIYWGKSRLTGFKKWVYSKFYSQHRNRDFFGDVEHSPFFWGDICQQKIKYVRNFVYQDLNTLKACPFIPYHDPHRPYVRYWFASSDGSNGTRFINRIHEANQDRLEQEGGASIIYTHLGMRVTENGAINPRLHKLLERLSKKNGWFVPVTTLLDYILQARGPTILNNRMRNQIELSWVRDQLRRKAERV